MTDPVLFAVTDQMAVLIDAADLDRVRAHHWRAVTDRAGRTICKTSVRGADGRDHDIAMHRFLLDLPPGRPFVRFLNGKTLDYRRANLVADSHATRGGAATTSRFRGVSWSATAKQWRAEIRISGEHQFLGHWRDEEEAADAYDAALIAAGGSAQLTNRALLARRRSAGEPEPATLLVFPQVKKRRNSREGEQ